MKKIFSTIWRYIRFTDKWLILFCVIASSLSVLLLYTISESNLGMLVGAGRRQYIVQALAMFIGLTCAVVMSTIDYHFMAKMWKFHMPVALFLVLLTFFIGIQVDELIDDKAWLQLPMGLTFQPAELLKISFILTFALHLSSVEDQLNRPSNVMLLCAHAAVPILLVHFQGDDGTALVFMLIFVAMIFASGLALRYIAAGGALLALAAPLAWEYLLSADQQKRFLSVYLEEFADPQVTGYQQRLSRISIGSGQLFGKGLDAGEYWYVPKVHNDFIFSFIGQALGFVGALMVVVLICCICFKMLRTSVSALDSLGRNICVGVFAMIFFQSLINIGMCVSLLPVVGITLPLFSAGGTSVVITYLGIGLVLSVQTHSRKNLFYE